MDWFDLKTELKNIFEDINNEIYLYIHLVQLCQICSIADCTRIYFITILELGTHALDSKTQVFQYIAGLKDNLKTQVLL